MRYGPDITKRIIEELQKMPNIRYVCNKVNIDHSTFYRWMSKHHTFYKLVTGALEMGRDRINEAAEGVIISGIQNNDPKSAIYWLSHNKARYSTPAQARYLDGINKNLMEVMKEPTPLGSKEATFEALFDVYRIMQDVYNDEEAKKQIDPLVQLMAHEDQKLVDIFYAAFEEWKIDNDGYDKKTLNIKCSEKP